MSRRWRRQRTLLTLACAVVVIAADQVTKDLAVHDLANGPVHVIGPFSFDLSYNTGVAFSIGSGIGLPIVLVVLSVVGIVIWTTRGLPSITGSIAVGLVLGGACGNLSDRLFRGEGGAVVDFIATSFWPTFNVADASIVIGALLLGISVWRHGGAASEKRLPDGSRT
ncbi:MAG TPA: signal peptidase II [Acidimicrobiales bacterium]